MAASMQSNDPRNPWLAQWTSEYFLLLKLKSLLLVFLLHMALCVGVLRQHLRGKYKTNVN